MSVSNNRATAHGFVAGESCPVLISTGAAIPVLFKPNSTRPLNHTKVSSSLVLCRRCGGWGWVFDVFTVAYVVLRNCRACEGRGEL